MPLSVGDKFGHYEVLSLLGQGGMGEVYRARDATLKRDVALKVLPAKLLRDPERMARLQREAEVMASLDHPNIGHIHGIVDSEDSRGLVLALIEGPTLGDRIEAGPIPVDEAVGIAKQIIEALEYAHDRGVIHRDLKPANVKITPEGVVKVLDFGLAKVLEDEPPASSLANSPTLTAGHTRAGVILGTAAYMSPEQAVGRPVDRRSDIFSFGAVLYEMLTGQRPFRGAVTPDVLEAVVKNDPDWSKLPPGGIDKLIRRCLTKDRKQRLQAIGEARIILSDPVGQVPDLPAKSSKLPWATATLLATTTAVALWAPWRTEKPVDRPLVRLDMDLGADVSLPAPTMGGGSVAISPDGTRLTYASGTPRSLYIRRLDQAKATALPETQGATTPFFSPDGHWVGFVAGNKLNKISVEGGAVVALEDILNFAGASWREDGSIFASEAFTKGLLRIPPGGGPPETIMGLGNGEIALGFPQTLPGGKAILFASANLAIEVLTLADRHRKIVVRGGTSPRYLATSSGAGHLVFVNKATLFAIPFDLDKLETRGTALPVLDDVAYEAKTGAGQLDFSRTGTLVYRRAGGDASAMTTVQWLDTTGGKEPLRAKPGTYQFLSLSPDGKRVALAVGEGGRPDIWVYDQPRDAMTRLTFGEAVYIYPSWSPDGQYVVFSSLGKGIFQARADGASQPKPLTQSKTTQNPGSFAPDGRRMAYTEATGGGQIWTVPLENQDGQLKAGKPEQFLKSQFSDQAPSFSPDGRWLAYYSNESGKNEVYVRAFPPPPSGQGGKWTISNNGGGSPRWSRNGRELFYQSGDRIMAVSYKVLGDTFVADKPRVWIANLGGTPSGRQWDLAPDGKRVVVLTRVESAAAPKQEHDVVLVENFFDELRRRVPAGK